MLTLILIVNMIIVTIYAWYAWGCLNRGEQNVLFTTIILTVVAILSPIITIGVAIATVVSLARK